VIVELIEKDMVLFYCREVESKISLLITGNTHPRSTLVPYSDVKEIRAFVASRADDLKAFMLEARMQQRPQDHGNALHHWLWSETAIGRLLGHVAQRLKQHGEDKAAFGIAR
jgi:hypothetical protein